MLFLLLALVFQQPAFAEATDSNPKEHPKDTTLVTGELPVPKDKTELYPNGIPLNVQDQPWFRNVGEWLSYRSVRQNLSTDPTSKIFTDGARFDVTVGKRIPFFSIGPSLTQGFVAGGDGNMYASLRRLKGAATRTFATETFDGSFGLFAGYTWSGFFGMFRWGHLSAHLVDNAATVASPVNYSHFWGEIILGKTWPNPEVASSWNLHIQGSAGMNYQSAPGEDNPRYNAGLDFGYSPFGANAWGFLTSADLQNAGVVGQKAHYAAFAGIGSLGRPESTHRPIRIGATQVWGSDERNQYYNRKDTFLGLDLSLEL